MPDPTCTATKANGEPCQAAPIPGRPFCPFHDPEHADRFAEGRSKGGAAPRRRIRRFPLVLDHLHIAQFLSELLVEALNQPEAVDPARLQAITALARTLLRTVGVPPTSHGCFQHRDRSEPPATGQHLLRLYRPLSEEEEALLAAEPEPADTEPPDAQSTIRNPQSAIRNPPDPIAERLNAGMPARRSAAPPDPPRGLDPMEVALEAWQASMAAAREASLATDPPSAPRPGTDPSDPSDPSALSGAAPEEAPAPEQAVDKSPTSPPATEASSGRHLSSHQPPSDFLSHVSPGTDAPVTVTHSSAEHKPAAADPEPLSPSDPDPNFLPAAPSVSPCLP